jgi:hypothetical protein
MISPTQRPLPDKTPHSQETNIHGPGGIRTRNHSKRVAADHDLDGVAIGIGSYIVYVLLYRLLKTTPQIVPYFLFILKACVSHILTHGSWASQINLR